MEGRGVDEQYLDRVDGVLIMRRLGGPKFGRAFTVGHPKQVLLGYTVDFAVGWATLNVFDPTFATKTIAPDGSNTASKFTENATNNLHRVSRSFVKAAASLAYSLVVYAKPGDRRLLISAAGAGGTNFVYAIFDLSGGQIGVPATAVNTGFAGSASMSVAANGFYRCALNVSATDITTGLDFILDLDNGVGLAALSRIYAGVNGQGVFIWGAEARQLV